MDKLTMQFQRQFNTKLIYDDSVFQNIDPKVKLHEETKNNALE